MNNEIKEIKIIKSNHSIVIIKNGVTVKEQFAIDDEILDYITNLQTIEQQYSAILSENAELENKITNLQDTLKDREEYCYGLETQITNLQEENKILKENAEHNDKVVDKARWNEMIYKSRNEKAIEYIEQLLREEFTITDEDNIDCGMKCQRAYFSDSELEKVIKKLQGSDKNE